MQDVTTAQEQTGRAPMPGQAGGAGMSLAQFDQITSEIRDQPEWRTEADKCADYYDSNQLDQETLQLLKDRGLAPIINNLIRPTIDLVLGMEAKTRQDWRVQADGDEFQEVAEALSERLFEAERETRSDRACSDAYAGQIKTGVGWVEVSKNSDPFQYPFRSAAIHRREIFWDWLARDQGLSDARYKVRKRWFDADLAAMYFPKHKDVLNAASQGWAIDQLQRLSEDLNLSQGFEYDRGLSLEGYEWRDVEGRRLCFAETWYRTPHRGYVLRLPDGRTVELDMKNPMHVAAISTGRIKPRPAIYMKMQMAVWAGPHKVFERPVKRNVDPYIPFFGYREDLTGIPYGLIRSMISPQDEINARRQKLMWLLSARRLTMDSDALDKKANTIQEVLEELARADAVIQLDPNRRNQNAFNVDSNLDVGRQQFEVMKDAEEALQRVAGVFQSMLGSDSEAKSGIAINSLVEQGTTTLAEINDNYRYSRRQVGEALLNLIRDDLSGQQVDVMVGEDPKRRTISLNKPAVDPQTNIRVLENDVERSRLKVALEDVPSTPAYRAQQIMMMTEVMKSLPPDVQAVLLPFYLESTEMPKRKQMILAVRQALKLPDAEYQPGQDPEKDQLMQAVQELQQQLQQVMASPELAQAQAKARDLAASAEKKIAETELIRAKTEDQQEINGEVAVVGA